MNNERILAHGLSKKLNVAELEGVSAAGTTMATLSSTHGAGGPDTCTDFTFDM